MLIRWLPLLAGLLPFFAAYIAYWIGVRADVLPACIPIIDGCVSISATGRNPPGSFLFRAVMLPQSVLLLMTWYFAVVWLRSLDNNVPRAIVAGIHVSSIVGALSLILYVTFLGTTEAFYEFMRRIGIYFYFLGTVTAEILVVSALLRIQAVQRHPELRTLSRLMLMLCLLPFALGLLNLYLKATLDNADASENIIEWIASTSMQGYLVVLFFSLRMSRFTLSGKSALHD